MSVEDRCRIPAPGLHDRQAGGSSCPSPTRTTCRVRGPWTPSTRSSSMSLVADGPLIQVSGRAGSSTRDGVGDVGDDLVGADDADVQVGHQAERAPALVGPRGRARWCRSRRCPTRARGDDGVDARRARAADRPSSTTAPGDVEAEAGGYDDALAAGERARPRVRRPGRRRSSGHHGAVVRDPLDEQRRPGRPRSAVPGGAGGTAYARLDAGRGRRRTLARISSRALIDRASSVGALPPGPERLGGRGRQVAGLGPRGAPGPGAGRRPATARAASYAEAAEHAAGEPGGRSARPSRRASRRTSRPRPSSRPPPALGDRSPRWASTTWARRSTSTAGMSMRTGHTSKQAPHSEEA